MKSMIWRMKLLRKHLKIIKVLRVLLFLPLNKVLMIDNPNIIVWNCRGAVGNFFFRFIKNYVDIYKPEVFVLMETMSDPMKLNSPLKKLGFHNFIAVENSGYAGGIIVACTDDKLKVSIISREEQFIHMEITNNHGQ